MRWRISTALVLAAFVAVNCQDVPVEPDSSLPTPSFSKQQNAFDAIDEILDAYASGWMAGDCEALRGLWAEDGISMGDDYPAVEGRETIYQDCLFFTSGCVLTDFVIDNHETRRAADLAYARGEFTYNYSCPSWSIGGCVDGKYLTVYERQGSDWKMLRDVYNDNVAECVPD